MPRYRVDLTGKNFWIKMNGKAVKLGFFTSRFVEADDEKKAELFAVQMVREDPKLDSILNEPTDSPMVFCDGVAIVDAFDSKTVVQPGFVFCPDNSPS